MAIKEYRMLQGSSKTSLGGYRVYVYKVVRVGVELKRVVVGGGTPPPRKMKVAADFFRENGVYYDVNVVWLFCVVTWQFEWTTFPVFMSSSWRPFC